MSTLDKFVLVKDVYLFCRQVTFKLLYHQPTLIDSFPDNEKQVFLDLLDLLQENEQAETRCLFPRRLPSQATPSFSLFPAIQIFFDKEKLDALVLKALDGHIITKKEADFLTTQSPVVPTFYALPKVHKSVAEPPANSVDFLDITLSIEDSKITCNLFRKITATNSLLHYGSFHPQHLKNGIPKGQFLRLRRNCSTNTDFLGQAKDLTKRFQQRGYPQGVISKAFQHARGQDRSNLLEKKIQPREYFNCRSRNLVYAIFCGCPKIYVGQTSQELRRRMQQHLSNIATASRDLRRDNTLSSVAAHFLEKHQGRPAGFKVMGLETVSTNIRGGNITNALLRCESKWIYKLQSCTPSGLNEDLLFTGFYKQL
ncbi:uncharacterized protein [Ranitomeya imitator]|uniref:uncharacterized protein n=1 Tax=Ranitomeya imitator TaxID=111125 RepID=UPI0037E9464A